MFNLWQRVHDEGKDVILAHADELSSLDWYEVEEQFPAFVPIEFRNQDPLKNKDVIWESPIGIFDGECTTSIKGAYSFRVPARGAEEGLWVCLALGTLIEAFSSDEDRWWDDIELSGNAPGGVLTCTCSCPGCAGLWEQRVHFSKLLVRVSVRQYKVRHDYFFARSVFEEGFVRMLHDMLKNRRLYNEPDMASFSEYDDFRNSVASLMRERSYLQDVWLDCIGSPFNENDFVVRTT